uniref:Putative LRR receptor-like serine/threonine-protein kinase At1g05700 n=1 Tax=Anthurium amnicola TaxID=1678845 RepID=A0A1D1ZDR1_9ARAE
MAGLLHLLLPLLLAVSASAQELLSIDCGASENYTNANGIGWVVDGPFVQRGEAHSVENTSGVPREFATLRAFTSRKKNCYTIPVNPGGWKMQILLRASFYYGNYDGKATPPAFDLLFEGNRWGTVETTAGDVVFTEAIYSVGEATSVCVAQTKPGQFPFISTIEVRNLEDDMYPNFDPNRWLLMRDRLAFGAARTIRYPDDRYDRIWMPARVNGLAVLKNESVVDVSPEAAKGRPPAAVFQAAVGTNSRSSPIALSTSLPSESTEVNINLYFAEMKQLRLTDVRAVDVTMDGVSLQAGSSAISAQEVLEFSISYRSANASTSIVVQAASDSTLPPIISAMEVFSVGDERQATDSGEVEILGMMQQRWPVLTDWTGDPCLPTPYNWEWVACSSDASPHISALLLSGLGLSGEFPEFSPVALSTVEKVDLHNNSLSGPIPHAFGLMPNLKEL